MQHDKQYACRCLLQEAGEGMSINIFPHTFACFLQKTKLRKRYVVGLEKLQSSAEQVEGMQQELRALQPQLVKTVAEVEELMGNIAREKKEVVEPKAAIVKASWVD